MASINGLYRLQTLEYVFTQMSNSPNILSSSNEWNGLGGQSWYDLALAVSPDNCQWGFCRWSKCLEAYRFRNRIQLLLHIGPYK